MQIGFGILLEGEMFNYVRKVQLELFKTSGWETGLKQHPHITIKSPFEVKELRPHFDYIDTLACEVEQFEIILNGFNHFDEKVIYLDVIENEQLSDIAKKISNDNNFLEEAMIFHVTIAYSDIIKGEFRNTYDSLIRMKTPKFKFTAKKIGIFYKLSQGSGWIIIKEVTLKEPINKLSRQK